MSVPPAVAASSLPAGGRRQWMAAVGRFITVQFAAQLLMAACGFLIVRSLTKSEYAIFVVANTLQGTMNALADAGATIGLTAIGGQHWQDRHRLGQIMNSTLAIRRKMVTAAVLAGTPLLVWMLWRNGASLLYAALLTAVSLAGLYFQVGLSVYRVVLQLHSRLGRLQQTDFLLAVLRLLLVGGFALWFLDAALAIGVMSLCLLVQWWQVRAWAWEEVDARATGQEEDRAFIRAKIRQVMPDTLFYCFQGQLWVILVTLFGGSKEMADVGALGRLAVIFNLVFVVMNNAVVPAFSRCQDLRTLRRRYVQITTAFALLGAGLVGLTWLVPGPLLWIIGGRYANLQYELVLSTTLTVVSGVSTVMWLLNAAKGWTNYLWLDIPLRLAIQTGLYFVLNLPTVSSVLWFSLLSTASPLIVTVWHAWRGMRSDGPPQNP